MFKHPQELQNSLNNSEKELSKLSKKTKINLQISKDTSNNIFSKWARWCRRGPRAPGCRRGFWIVGLVLNLFWMCWFGFEMFVWRSWNSISTMLRCCTRCICCLSIVCVLRRCLHSCFLYSLFAVQTKNNFVCFSTCRVFKLVLTYCFEYVSNKFIFRWLTYFHFSFLYLFIFRRFALFVLLIAKYFSSQYLCATSLYFWVSVFMVYCLFRVL